MGKDEEERDEDDPGPIGVRPKKFGVAEDDPGSIRIKKQREIEQEQTLRP